jgi:hypothetical protein
MMNSGTKSVIIALAGLSLFSAGAWVRSNADELGTVVGANGVRYLTRGDVYIDLSHPPMWCGAALALAAAARWLFPRQPRAGAGTENVEREPDVK